MPDLGPDTWVARSAEPVGAEVGDGVVLLSIRSGAYVSLNATAAAIWRRLGQPMQVRALCDDIAREYDTATSQCMPSVLACLDKLIEGGVAHIQVDPSLELIKK